MRGTVVLGFGKRRFDFGHRWRHRRFGRFIERPLAFFYQCGNRVRRIDRIQIKHQAVLILVDRRQGKHLWIHFFLQVEYEAHHARPVLADAHLLDIRVVRLDLGDQAFQRRVQVDAFDIHHQPFRILDDEVIGLQVRIVFQRDAGVILGWPDAHRKDLRRESRQWGKQGDQQSAACLEDSAADFCFHRFGANFSRFRHSTP
ncbi:hypothetical protein D3C81_1696190 [compost metagenome]